MENLWLVAAACAALGACSQVKADPPVSAQLDSGITSSNGGGQRALGNVPNIGVTNGVTTMQRTGNTPGTAY